MEKLLVVSALKDDCYQKNAAHFLEKHLEDVKSGAEKFAQMSGAKILFLLPEGAKAEGLDNVRYGICTPTGDNPYSCAQQLKGNLPRPMIQDDYIAEYDGNEVNVITVESAYWLAKGTDIKHVTINGEVKEIAMGTKLNEVVDAADAKAVLVGGLKGRLVLPEQLGEYEVSTDFLYDSVDVIPKSACIVDTMIKHLGNTWNYSCGKCVVCREGTLQFKTICEEMVAGKAKPADIDLLKEVGELIKEGSYCPYGQNWPQAVIDAITLFADEFDAHIKRKTCPANVCFQKGATYVILPDKCTGCTDCIDECDEMAIEGKKGFIHMIDQDMCESCGKCVEACDEEAIVIVEGKMPKLPKKLTRVGKF